MALDSETRNNFEDVRRGKPRHFVMICKGVKILGMMLYKIGSIDTYKKKVKEIGGAGVFFHGLVDGQGENITFYLRRGDGFDKLPGKELALKEFLKAETGMKFKPTYELVEVFPTGVSGSDEPASDGPDGDGMADWQAARSAAIGALKQVAKQIAESKHPKSAAAILDIKAVIGNLAEAPASQQEVGQIEQFLAHDKAAQNVLGMSKEVGPPLLDRLKVLKPMLPA